MSQHRAGIWNAHIFEEQCVQYLIFPGVESSCDIMAWLHPPEGDLLLESTDLALSQQCPYRWCLDCKSEILFYVKYNFHWSVLCGKEESLFFYFFFHMIIRCSSCDSTVVSINALLISVLSGKWSSITLYKGWLWFPLMNWRYMTILK